MSGQAVLHIAAKTGSAELAIPALGTKQLSSALAALSMQISPSLHEPAQLSTPARGSCAPRRRQTPACDEAKAPVALCQKAGLRVGGRRIWSSTLTTPVRWSGSGWRSCRAM
jgi:hypothetical protein